MKIEFFLEDVLSEAHFHLFGRIARAESDTFSELSVIAGLDPSKDFRHSDLTGVDFKDSDLRGYDFTGADLRGASGLNVIWDESTVLEGAEVSGSIFAYEALKRNLLNNGVWRKELERRNKDFWSKNIEWFSDRLTKGHRDRAVALELAKAVCDGTADTFLRSQLLFFLAPAFDNALEHRDYLIHNLAKHSSDATTIRVTLQTIAALYNNDRSGFRLLMSHLNHSDHLVRDAAMKGVLRSKLLRNHIREITVIIQKFSLSIRQAYLSRIGEMLGVNANSVKDNFGRVYDINEQITSHAVERAAFFQLRAEDMRRTQGLRKDGNQVTISDPKRERVLERVKLIKSDLNHFVEQGFPLRVDWRN